MTTNRSERNELTPIEFLPHDYVVENPRKPRPIAIDGIMRVGDLVLISGGWDSFKSTLAMELAWSLATGKRWLGRAEFGVHRQMRMGIIQTEIDPGAYDERAKRFPKTDNLLLASVMDFTFDRMDELEERLNEAEMDGLVIDPMGQCWPAYSLGGEPFSENSKTHVAAVMRDIKRLRRTIIMVHHDPKATGDPNGPKNRASGSASLLNDPDVRMFIDRLPGNNIKVTVRNRLQHPAPPFVATFSEETYRLYASGTMLVEPPKRRPGRPRKVQVQEDDYDV